MRRVYQLTIILVVALVWAGCQDHPVDFSYPENNNFFQSWTRSYEEETDPDGRIQIYRPSDSLAFPPSWFRNSYVFNADGTGEWRVLHPTDAHYMEPATWKADPEDQNLISIHNPVGTEVVRFKIRDLASDFMRIELLKYEVPECNFIYGKVDVYFYREATFNYIDAFVRSLGLEYAYRSVGQVFVRVEVISGNPEEIMSQLVADEIVHHVTHVIQSYPDDRDFFVISFVVDINTDDIVEFIESYSELEIISINKTRAWVRFDVPAGDEEEWVARFVQEPLVENSRKAGEFCP
jgi:hypothetical protein